MIPTGLDLQQAMMQVLQSDWDRTFSEHSLGFRPRRSAHQAVARAWPLGPQQQPCARDCYAERLYALTRPCSIVPVCTVVWEARSGEAPPYPDLGNRPDHRHT